MRRVGIVTTVLLGLLAASAPATANFVGQAPDPAGDSTGGPGRDITDFFLEYDKRAGTMRAGLRLAGDPLQTPSFVTLAAGVRTPTGCGYPAVTFGTHTDDAGAGWFRFEADGPSASQGDADKTGRNQPVQTFEAEAPELAGAQHECIVAILSAPGDAATTYDVAGPVDLVAYPSLRMGIPDEDQRIEVGSKRSFRVTLTNTGDAPATALRLRVKAARGIRVKPARRSLGTLAPGAKRRVKVTARVGKRARSTSDLVLTARTGKLAVEGKVRVRRVDPRRPGNGDGDRTPIPSTCTQYSPDPFGGTGGSLVLVPCTR